MIHWKRITLYLALHEITLHYIDVALGVYGRLDGP